MKNIKFLLTILVILATASCSDELDKELFRKYTYLANNGITDYNLELDENNRTELGIHFGINGTSDNDQDIVIEIESNSEILKAYNFDKYKNQVHAYYPELPPSCYTFDKDSYTIVKGELKTTALAIIDLNKLSNPYKEYVLPIKVKSSTGAEVGPDEYTELLAHILFTNRYSGQYAGSGKLKEVGTSYVMDISSIRLYATSSSSCYIYAGNVTRTTVENYVDYAIDLAFEHDGKITMTAKNDDLEFQPLSAAIDYKYSLNYDDNRFYNQNITLSLKYRYKDLSEDGGSRTLEYDGACSITKKVLITDYPNVTIEE